MQRPFTLQHLVIACQGINPDQSAAQPQGAMAEGADMVGAHKHFACVLSCGLQSSYDAIVKLFDTVIEGSLAEWYIQSYVLDKGSADVKMLEMQLTTQHELISAGRICAATLRNQLFFWLCGKVEQQLNPVMAHKLISCVEKIGCVSNNLFLSSEGSLEANHASGAAGMDQAFGEVYSVRWLYSIQMCKFFSSHMHTDPTMQMRQLDNQCSDMIEKFERSFPKE